MWENFARQHRANMMPTFFIINQKLIKLVTQKLQSVIWICDQVYHSSLTLISHLVRDKQGVKYTPLPKENMWISWLLFELQSWSKNKRILMIKLIWGGNTFKSSIYHRFYLKPGFVFFFLKILPVFGYLGF